MDVGRLNALRGKLRALMNDPRPHPPALVYLRYGQEHDETEPLTSPAKTIASELGLRFVDLDLAGGLTEERRCQLARGGPRLVLVRNLGLAPPPDIEQAIRATARSIILVDTIVTEASASESIASPNESSPS